MNLKSKIKYLLLVLPFFMIDISNEKFVIKNKYTENLFESAKNCVCGIKSCRYGEHDCECVLCSSTSSSTSNDSNNRGNNRKEDVPTKYPSGMVGSGADYQPNSRPQKCPIAGAIYNPTIGYCVNLSDHNLNVPSQQCWNQCYTRNGEQSCGAVLYTTGIYASCIWYSVDAPTYKPKQDETVGSPTLSNEYPIIPGTVAEIAVKDVKETVAIDGCTGSYNYDKVDNNDTYEYKNIMDLPSVEDLGYINVKNVLLMAYVNPNNSDGTKIVKYACSLESRHAINFEVTYESLSKVEENKFGTGTGILPNVSVTAGTIQKEVVGYGLADDLEQNPTSKKCPQVYYKIELNDGSIVEKTVDHPACADNKQVDLREMCGYGDDTISNLDTTGTITITENDKKTNFTSVGFEINNVKKFEMPMTYIDILTGKIEYGSTYASDDVRMKAIENGYYISYDAKTGTGKILVDATTKYTTNDTNPKVNYTINFNVSCPFDIVNRTTNYNPDDDNDGGDDNGAGYIYRPIDVDSLFEHRESSNDIEKLKDKVGSNWRRYYFTETNGYTTLRDRIGDTYNNNAKYRIVLTNETINKIRDYNDNHNYLDMEFGEDGSSKFLAEEIAYSVEKPTSTTGSIGGANASHYRIGCGPLNQSYSWCNVSGGDN